ncbi:MAG: hypothetical protein WC620_07810 [Methanoregula sp.]|jgi:hypothetical protein
METFSGLKAPGMMGTRRQWQAFYPTERPCLSDLVIEGVTDRIREWDPDTGLQPVSPDGTFAVEELLPAPGGSRRLRFTVTSVMNNDGELIAAVETIEEIYQK